MCSPWILCLTHRHTTNSWCLKTDQESKMSYNNNQINIWVYIINLLFKKIWSERRLSIRFPLHAWLGFVMGILQVRKSTPYLHPSILYHISCNVIQNLWYLWYWWVIGITEYSENTNGILQLMTYWLLKNLDIWIRFLPLPFGSPFKNILKKIETMVDPRTETQIDEALRQLWVQDKIWQALWECVWQQ